MEKVFIVLGLCLWDGSLPLQGVGLLQGWAAAPVAVLWRSVCPLARSGVWGTPRRV